MKTVEVKVQITNDAELPAFGAYLAGSAPEGTAEIKINFSAIFSSIADTVEIEPGDWNQIAADTIVHELLHAVEDILGKAFSEVDIEKSIEMARSSEPECSSARQERTAWDREVVGSNPATRIE